MSSWRAHPFRLIAAAIVVLALIWMFRGGRPEKASPSLASSKVQPALKATPGTPKADVATATTTSDRLARLVSRELRAGLQSLLNRRDARAREALLTFKDEEAYRKFLARAGEAGLKIIGQLDSFRTARVSYDALDVLQRDLLAHASDYSDVAPNLVLSIPQTPPKEDRAAVEQVPFGNRMLDFLGATGDRSQWGRGTTIAVLDSGVAGDPTFGEGRLKALDIGFGIVASSGNEGGHGTAVAALAAGFSADAPGVAPGANLLSIRVTDASGTSDIFTVSQAILAAVDAGAKVINISLGGYGTTGTLDAAIGYASERGAIIVAAAGNDQAAQLAWPAADSRVVSVGSVDAAGQQVLFSNSGEQLKMTAPGYGVQTAWLENQRVSMSGTSASAPIVAGAIAAVMSENPGFTAQQAWQVLQQTANDSGAPGADANYGSGILNLGWAMNRHNLSYADTAIASHYYDSANSQMLFVIQNRGTQAVGGLQFNLTAGMSTQTYGISTLGSGATTVIKQPVNANAVKAGGVGFDTQLVNPSGFNDRMPGNNRKSTVLTPVAK